MSGYWPWWAGALALGAITVAHARLTGRPMGVSGSLAKVAHPVDELAADRLQADMLGDQAALEAALAAATAEEFGDAAARDGEPGGDTAPATVELPPGAPLAGHVAFLAMLGVGALLASMLRGGWHLHVSAGAVYEHLIGAGPVMLAALFGGGLLVGVGTRMSGGCTSGHGLSGCARLMPSSLVATATFMAGAVGTSFLLGWLAR